MILERPDIKPIWTNCCDSLLHAGYHFEELESIEGQRDKPWYLQDKVHHSKWATLSVGHATDCYLKIIAKDLDCDCPLFRHKKRLFRNPSIPETISYLKKHLPNSWRALFQVLEYVHAQRNQIVHHIIPEEMAVSVSVAAWGLLGLLRSMSERYDVSSDSISGSVEETLISLIKPPRLQPYMKHVEDTLAELYPTSVFVPCPLCGTMSVCGGRCEACFASISTVTCDQCAEECIIPDDSDLAEHLGLNVCSSCGTEL